MPKRRRNPITKQIRSIRRALTAIDRSLGRLVTLTNAKGRGFSVRRAAKKRTLKLSPERRAALKLQGQYMGYMRGLKPRQKALVKAVRAEKGFRTAIGMARRMAKA